MSHARILPGPTPLPNLKHALAKRAAIFGPFDHDEVRLEPMGMRAAFGAMLRQLADLLEPKPLVLDHSSDAQQWSA